MELFKEKEEVDVVKKHLDPEGGRVLNDIDYGLFDKNIKAKTHRDIHAKDNDDLSAIKKLEEEFKHTYEDISEIEHDVILLPEELDDVLISVEELISFLDSSEEEI